MSSISEPNSLFLFLFFYFIHLFMRDTEQEREAEIQAEGKQAPFREPDVGLDPGSPGSHPGPKTGTKPLSHPGIPPAPSLESRFLYRPDLLPSALFPESGASSHTAYQLPALALSLFFIEISLQVKHSCETF